VLYQLVLNAVVTKQSGVSRILEALHFPIRTETFPGLGQLPITVISSTLSTVRPTDDVIIKSTEISGTDTFEELLNTENVRRLANPFKETLVPNHEATVSKPTSQRLPLDILKAKAGSCRFSRAPWVPSLESSC
jgi:hypothetical protein